MSSSVQLCRAEYNKSLLIQVLAKDLEDKSGLKVAVIGAGTQLVHLREADGDSDRDPDLCSIQSQLRQLELDWDSLRADLPVVQQALHKVK